jgi:large subunit ribosomal protein L19
MINQLIQHVEENYGLKKDFPEFEVGDTVDVHTRIVEGDKERIQVFTGTVIARKGSGVRQNFTVRRIVAGEGVERVFPIHSPILTTIEVKRPGRARRAKLYYLRERVGKATKTKERRGVEVAGEGAPPPEAAPAKPKKREEPVATK